MIDVPEFVLNIEPGAGTSLRISVQASGLAPIEDEVERAPPSFPPADLDLLRSGSALQPVADALAEQVTSWLLQGDMRGLLGTAFNAAAAPFRIVIRVHPKVDLAEVPFELLKFNADSLVLLQNVRAIVHMIKRPRAVPPLATRSGWPFRALLVRSNPADLGGQVPPILPLRDSILAIARARGLGDAVVVGVLSSEPGGSGPVTYDALRAELDARSCQVLVYLGHGDLQDAGFEGFPRMGVLQFEHEGSPYADPICAEQLRYELLGHPVPVVVLAGCVTAASDAVMRRFPQWMRGAQSVAEALVFGESGVQCAVGMRYRLETEDANRFLAAFFESLLQSEPGDVERAVHRGRDAMLARKLYPPSWSAPVIFRTASAEPMFEWLRGQPGLLDPLDEPAQRVREQYWRALSSMPSSVVESRAFPSQFLGPVESDVVERWTKRGFAVCWPARIEAKPGEIVHVGVTHQGALRVSCLKGRLTFPEILGRAPTARPTDTLRAAGFRAQFDLDEPGAASFTLIRPDGAAEIPSGPLVEIDLELPATTPAVYSLSVDSLQSDPAAPLHGWSNAVVLSPP
jgi:CHAT domain